MIQGYINETNNTRGNVKITVLDNGKVREVINKHNSGTVELSKFLRDALIGASSIDRMPDRIVPIKCTTTERSENAVEELLSYGVQLNSRSSSGESGTTASAVLKFLIPGSVLSSGTSVSGFKLYSGKLSNGLHYATVILSSDIEISGNTSILVDWTISVSPKE